MAELADAEDLKSSEGNLMRVRVPLRALCHVAGGRGMVNPRVMGFVVGSFLSRTLSELLVEGSALAIDCWDVVFK